MTISFVCLPLSGHLNPMIALARKLQSRGHEVSFIGVADSAAIVRAADLPFTSYCEDEFPPGAVAKTWGPVSQMHGMDVVRYGLVEINPKLLDAALRHLPEKIKENGIEALVLDPIHFFVELVPMALKIPFVQVCTVLHLDSSGATPPSLFSWPYDTAPEALARNGQGLQEVASFFAASVPIAAAYAEKAGLQVDWSRPGATNSKLAFITQTPREFDFPGIPWPAEFHYTGPFADNTGRRLIPFNWDWLNGDPLIHASLRNGCEPADADPQDDSSGGSEISEGAGCVFGREECRC